MNWKRDSLAYTEFVAPILAVVEPFEACTVKHYSEVESSEIGGFSHIILSGTTLKDFAFLEKIANFNWIKTCSKPVLGVCAGMQTILQVYGEPLEDCSKVGMTEITTKKSNPLFSGAFQAYTLHSYTAKPDGGTFEVLAESAQCIQAIKHKQKPIYGVLFHPEVRNQSILERFVKL
jgi:GMP synthase (glutamine-hydrolysing)